ncbi:hypothetical protein GCM10022214_60830 [Actinomadura miaoliensis]|uniref:Uncharacterized protein n=1 Tax=Actinomadura miaoliensis TaxID=430685 RepID=A0ABP7WLB5_9ACTN
MFPGIVDELVGVLRPERIFSLGSVPGALPYAECAADPWRNVIIDAPTHQPNDRLNEVVQIAAVARADQAPATRNPANTCITP